MKISCILYLSLIYLQTKIMPFLNVFGNRYPRVWLLSWEELLYVFLAIVVLSVILIFFNNRVLTIRFKTHNLSNEKPVYQSLDILLQEKNDFSLPGSSLPIFPIASNLSLGFKICAAVISLFTILTPMYQFLTLSWWFR